MVDQCKLCFIHPNENLYKEMFLWLLSCWDLCDPNLEHYSITLSGAHTGAARVSWEHILSSEAFEVGPSLVAGSLKNKSNQINNKKKNPKHHKETKPKQTAVEVRRSQLLQDQHISSRLH